jgi:hypothetical protein
MATLETAIAFARRAHGEQIDQQGRPYLSHVLNVASRVSVDDEKMVAVLHDVLEDTATTPENLRDAGFSQEIIGAVDALSRRKGEPYVDFIRRIRLNPLAVRVKQADLQENFNLPRTLLRGERLVEDLRRLGRYALSDQYLRGDLSEMAFLEGMSRLETIG